MPKVKMLRDEIVLTEKGPVRLVRGDVAHVGAAIASSLIGRGYAEDAEPKKEEAEEKKPRSRRKKKAVEEAAVEVSDEKVEEEAEEDAE